MPNANFASSVLPNAVIRMEDIFSGQNSRYAQYKNKKSELIKAINERQTARMNEVFMNGKCIGIQMVWTKDCTALGGYACETAPSACAVPLIAETMTTDTQTINPTCYFDEGFSLSDDLCNNEYTAEELIAEKMAIAVHNMDIRLNRYAYAEVSAKAQANTDPDTLGTVAGTLTTITPSAWTSDILVELEVTAQYNGLENYMIFDARNLLTQKNLSAYRALNADEASGGAIFNDWDGRLVFDDPRDSKAVTSRNSTFFVDMGMVAFVNRTSYPTTAPELADSSDNFYTFHVVSPRTGIRYDVEYQKACTGRDTTNRRIYQHKFNVKFIGGIVFPPVQCDSGTGILEFVKA